MQLYVCVSISREHCVICLSVICISEITSVSGIGCDRVFGSTWIWTRHWWHYRTYFPDLSNNHCLKSCKIAHNTFTLPKHWNFTFLFLIILFCSVLVKSLSSFEYVEPSGKDMGLNVRKKAETIVALLNNKDKIQEVRNKAAANRDKYVSLKDFLVWFTSTSGKYELCFWYISVNCFELLFLGTLDFHRLE